MTFRWKSSVLGQVAVAGSKQGLEGVLLAIEYASTVGVLLVASGQLVGHPGFERSDERAQVVEHVGFEEFCRDRWRVACPGRLQLAAAHICALTAQVDVAPIQGSATLGAERHATEQVRLIGSASALPSLNLSGSSRTIFSRAAWASSSETILGYPFLPMKASLKITFRMVRWLKSAPLMVRTP